MDEVDWRSQAGQVPYVYSSNTPFLRLEDPRYAEMLTDAAVVVLGERGVDRLSVGSLARWLKVTPAAVLKDHPRARVIELVLARFGDRWLEWANPGRSSPLPAQLPGSDEEVHGVRVHRALSELARSELLAGNDTPSRIWSEVRRDELAAIRRRLETSECDAEQVLALATGLRIALAEPEPTLTYGAASDMLRRHAAGLLARRP